MSDKIRIVFILIKVLCVASLISSRNVEKEACTALARDEESLLVFSTLGGRLTAVDPITSETRWTINEDPPVVVEQQQNFEAPQYLPDPKDGSIYELGNMGSLKKLPYTIPQLVASAPCRSSDGIFYSGKKSDTWFLVDPKTGKREKLLGFGQYVQPESEEGKSWASSRYLYLGRTQYTVMMYDSHGKNKNSKPWNITFYDYTAHTMASEISDEYEYIHLTTTSTGLLVTLDRKSGKILWKKDLFSPVVGAFFLGTDGLISIPFTTVSDEALNTILKESNGGSIKSVPLFQSLYIGEHSHGLYALPSFVSTDTPILAADLPVKLLDGPNEHDTPDENKKFICLADVLRSRNSIILGHYKISESSDKHAILSYDGKTIPNNQIAISEKPKSSSIGLNLNERYIDQQNSNIRSAEMGVQTDPLTINTFNNSQNDIKMFSHIVIDWLMNHPSSKIHQILILIVLGMIGMFWYMLSSVRELKNQSENGSKTQSSKGENVDNFTHNLLDLGGGEMKVGKITYNSNEVLGKGCDGTFVFKGCFEKRSVAVKRLLPECFTFADREVALLRESDAHENVVRYFCTEQDRQFRYIAVELCAATLQDYIEGERSRELSYLIDKLEALQQAASGLAHLHSLNIVHRDIKPQNVLLSLPGINHSVRVMISDFGLCKKLNFGKSSFSRRSGVTGTDGWIAPEMMKGLRTTTAVDIFSLGCVYYYVLSGGEHAFGDALKRQANILANEFDLSKINETKERSQSKMILAKQLVSDMISKNAQSRPPAKSIGNHPLFWDHQKILSFLQDVSDRVEKLQLNVEPLRSLEKCGRIIVLEDWSSHLDTVISEDLRKYRGYIGISVRDLLRALRNKKHHYHELSHEAQDILGSIPDGFTKYWIEKFPQLISHTYHALSFCSRENIFKPYYDNKYRFTPPTYFSDDDSQDFKTLLSIARPPAQNLGSPKKHHNNGRNYNDASPKPGYYNYRKQPDLAFSQEDEADKTNSEKKDVFANFKFRRGRKIAYNKGKNPSINLTHD